MKLLFSAIYLLMLPLSVHATETSWSYFEDAARLATPTDGQVLFAPRSVPPYGRAPAGAKTLVDTHVHVFHHGLGLISSGKFNDAALWAKWNSRFVNQVNAAGLEASDLGLVVVALYGHPILSLSSRASVRRQIRMAHEFVATHPDWVIARSEREAREAQARGQRVLVFSLEGAATILKTEADLREFVDDAGIRIVTFAHLSDDQLSGAALMRGYQLFGNPLAALGAICSGSRGGSGEWVNPRGLTSRGRSLARALLDRGVWLDLAHASKATARELAAMMRERGQPLLYTHGGLDDYHAAEREYGEADLRAVAESGGIIGLVPAQSIIGNAPWRDGDTSHRDGSAPSRSETCSGGIYSLAGEFEQASAAVGAQHVFIGTDFSGAMDHLPPTSPGCHRGTTIDEKGFANISQTGELWQLLGELAPSARANQLDGVTNFLDVWARVRPAR